MPSVCGTYKKRLMVQTALTEASKTDMSSFSWIAFHASRRHTMVAIDVAPDRPLSTSKVNIPPQIENILHLAEIISFHSAKGDTADPTRDLGAE